MVGVAVKLTVEPAHMLVLLAETETEGTTIGLTVIVILLLVPFGTARQVALLVMTQVIASPFTSVDEV